MLYFECREHLLDPKANPWEGVLNFWPTIGLDERIAAAGGGWILVISELSEILHHVYCS